MQALAGLIILFTLITGIIVAHGFWSTFFAFVFCPWGLYLGVEHFLIILKLI